MSPSPQAVLALAVSAVLWSGSADARSSCAKHYAVQANPMIGLSDVKRLAGERGFGPASPAAKDGSQLVVLPFDYEDHPVHGRWRSIALVYVTRGDLGEDTVGVALLQDRSLPPFRSDLVVKKDGDGLALSMPNERRCPGYVIRLDATGGLTAQGAFIGRLAP